VGSCEKAFKGGTREYGALLQRGDIEKSGERGGTMATARAVGAASEN